MNQGEKITIVAQKFFSGCTTHTYTQFDHQPAHSFDAEVKYISQRNVVVRAELLAKAIGECDQGTMNSIFNEIDNHEIIQTLTCDLQPDFKSSAIRFACAHLNTESVLIMLKSLSFTDKKLVIGHKGHDGLSAFHVAVERENTDLVLKLMDLQLADPEDPIPVSTRRNKNQDTRTRPGDTAVEIAKGCEEIYRAMIDYISVHKVVPCTGINENYIPETRDGLGNRARRGARVGRRSRKEKKRFRLRRP